MFCSVSSECNAKPAAVFRLAFDDQVIINFTTYVSYLLNNCLGLVNLGNHSIRVSRARNELADQCARQSKHLPQYFIMQ